MTLPNRKNEEVLTATRLRELFIYDPASGIFTYRILCGGVRAGTIAGCISPLGYRYISIKRRKFFAHRLAWFYVHGTWPSLYLDHINGIPGDNRIANLREANHRQNIANSRSRSGCPLKGITYLGDKWKAQIRHNGRNLFLGHFDTAEQAAVAYAAKAKEIHGEFARGP